MAKNNQSRILNWEEIRDQKLLKHYNDENFKEASYDLSVGEIFNIEKCKVLTEIEIQPQGMILVISKEEFDLPRHVIAHTTVKNNLSIQGILGLNIGGSSGNFMGKGSNRLNERE
ncbi:hypothetical protein [Leptospira santarosai]|uniref:hypothetical protein n=1 Tax=Leptospira santarosai TaxID=28183 RepID=UPI000ACDCB30|nr:hypothetical protein [Leptospira santarosai]